MLYIIRKCSITAIAVSFLLSSLVLNARDGIDMKKRSLIPIVDLILTDAQVRNILFEDLFDVNDGWVLNGSTPTEDDSGQGEAIISNGILTVSADEEYLGASAIASRALVLPQGLKNITFRMNLKFSRTSQNGSVDLRFYYGLKKITLRLFNVTNLAQGYDIKDAVIRVTLIDGDVRATIDSKNIDASEITVETIIVVQDRIVVSANAGGVDGFHSAAIGLNSIDIVTFVNE